MFVDDSPLELDEVKTAWPDVTCLRFPRENDTQILALLESLRDLFGKRGLSAEDALRAESIRRNAQYREEQMQGTTDPNAFLASLDAEIAFQGNKSAADARVLELLNKTNQFNLNGQRYGDGDWRAYLDDPTTWVLSVEYRDKFGPLGTIAVLTGHQAEIAGGPARVDSWVMSCRAFSRRIEHACLRALFDWLEVPAMAFALLETPKNGPLRSFFADLLGGEPSGLVELTREVFEAACPPLSHRIKEPLHV